MPRSRHVRPLTDEERDQLTEVHQRHPSFLFRRRAQAILLSEKGNNLKQLQALLEVDRDTISGWLDRFEQSGSDGLADQPRPGRPPIYTADDLLKLKAFIAEEPRSPKQAQARLESETGKKSCTETVKRALKKTPPHVAPLPKVGQKPSRR